MTYVSSELDRQALTLTFVAEFDAAPERVWQVWEDPRQLERWWGPPAAPATFDRHEFVPGGRSVYHMSIPDGGKAYGWWSFTAIAHPHQLAFDEGFADENGEPTGDLGASHVVTTLEGTAGGGTRMTTVTRFTSADKLEQMMAMGMEEGSREAMDQIDALLADNVRA